MDGKVFGTNLPRPGTAAKVTGRISAPTAVWSCQASTAALLQGTATAIPCDSASFDGIISECVLSLICGIDVSLREMYRVHRPGGLLLLTDIYRKQSQPQVDLPGLKNCITHALSLEEIKAGPLQSGFALLLSGIGAPGSPVMLSLPRRRGFLCAYKS